MMKALSYQHIKWAQRVCCLVVMQTTEIVQTLSSVAEVLFRTAPENQNWQNQTIKFSSVLFSLRNFWSCSVLGSYIWEDIQNRVWTSLNRTSSDIILYFQTEAVVCLSKCHLFFFYFYLDNTGTFIKSTLEKSLGLQETTIQDPRKELCDYLESPLEHVNDPVKWWGVSKPVSFYAGLTTYSSTIPVNTLRYPRWLVTILLFKARRLHPRGPFRVQQFQMTFGITRQRARLLEISRYWSSHTRPIF